MPGTVLKHPKQFTQGLLFGECLLLLHLRSGPDLLLSALKFN